MFASRRTRSTDGGGPVDAEPTVVGLVVFESHHLAFRAEAILNRLRVPYAFSIVPAPRHLSLSCAYALQVPADRLAETEAALAGAGLVEGLAYHKVNLRAKR